MFVQPAARPDCWLASWLSFFYHKNLNGHCTQIFQPNSFHTFHACIIGTIDFTICYTFTDLDLGWGSVTRSAQRKTIWIHFPAHFSTHQDENVCGVEAIQIEHLDPSGERFFGGSRKITAVLLAAR